ncbi:MAG: ATP-binding protein [Cyanobacteria bacterium J06635_10]
MNTPPQLQSQFQKIILQKSQNFTNSEFIFNIIKNFIQNYNRGYFTIIGSPGSGKSAILAKYIIDNPDAIYYNAQVEGKNTAKEFLKYICTQLISRIDGREWGVEKIPENTAEASSFFSLLLQNISVMPSASSSAYRQQPTQRLIIAIDALNAINPNSQPPGTNLFYLPRYIPNGVYFLLTRRPFKTEQSGLLIESPSQILNLSEYGLKNWENEQNYTQHWQKMQGEGLSDVGLQVLRVLTSAENEGASLHQIMQITDADVLDIQEVLDNWFEFLQQKRIGKESHYSLYHPHFRDWLAKQISNL